MSTPGTGPAVVALTGDLMDRSRISARHPGASLVRDVPALLAAAASLPADGVVFVDLARPGALDAVSALADEIARGVQVVAYGSHVDADVLGEAQARGATEVLARSVFFRRLGGPGDGPQ